MFNRKLIIAACALALTLPQAYAQVPWQVVAGEHGSIAASNLPAGVYRGISEYYLGDAGGDHVGIRVSSPDAYLGYWASKQGVLTRYTENNVGGFRGPGRSGPETNHVFLNVYSDWGAASSDGQRVFAARAGDPANTANASYGLWRWDTVRNVEVARSFVDTTLGPGLGSGWVFPNSSTFASARMMSGGQMLISSIVNNVAIGDRLLLTKHLPGQGNRPCMMRNSTDPALGPGLGGNVFDTSWDFTDLAVTPQGRVYGSFRASSSRGGIWEICNGVPQPLVLDDVADERGPDIGISGAMFTSEVYAPYPGVPGTFFFFSYFKLTPSSSSAFGLFLHNGSRNVPLAYNDAGGLYGPNWAGSTWNQFNTETLSTGGEYAAFSASVSTAAGGSASGFWRIRRGNRPELVALIGSPSQYNPEPNRTWRSFGASAVLSNGDILLEARTDPGDTLALWLLERGNPTPRKILEPGQTINFTSTTGPTQATVSSFDISNGGAGYSRGNDSWVGADGTVMVVADLTGYGEVALKARASDRIFSSGFN